MNKLSGGYAGFCLDSRRPREKWPINFSLLRFTGHPLYRLWAGGLPKTGKVSFRCVAPKCTRRASADCPPPVSCQISRGFKWVGHRGRAGRVTLGISIREIRAFAEPSAWSLIFLGGLGSAANCGVLHNGPIAFHSLGQEVQPNIWESTVTAQLVWPVNLKKVRNRFQSTTSPP